MSAPDRSVAQAKAHSISAQVELGRKASEVGQLQVELGKAVALLFQLHARVQTQREARRRTVRLVGYLFVRWRRTRRPPVFTAAPRPRAIPDWIAAAVNP